MLRISSGKPMARPEGSIHKKAARNARWHLFLYGKAIYDRIN